MNYNDFLNEGTWSHGSASSMLKLAKELENMAKKSKDADDLLGQLEGIDKKMYSLAGDDNVHDQFDSAKSNAEAKDLEGAKTSIYDTVAAIKNLSAQIHESNENNMKYTKNYGDFLNEAKFDAKKFRKEAEAIPFEEWVVDWEHGQSDGYYYVAAEWKGKYYLQWGAIVNAGEDLEDIDFSEEGEYITKKEYENIAY
jgi:hypothetical protein